MAIVNNNILIYQNHKENRFSTKASSVCEVIFKLAWCDNSIHIIGTQGVAGLQKEQK